MKLIETGLQTVGAQTVSRWWTYGRKLVSYLSSGLHFDSEQPARLAAGPSRHFFILASSDFCLLSLSQPFLLTLLYLTDIFRWSCQWGLHFSTPNFNVLDRTRPVPNKIPFLFCSHSCCWLWHKATRFLFFLYARNVVLFFLKVGMLSGT